MIPDFRNFNGEGMRQLMHSAKGTTWTKKNAKYTDKVKTKNGTYRYIYGDSGSAKTIGKSAIKTANTQLSSVVKSQNDKPTAKSIADTEVNRAKTKISQGTKKGKEDAMKKMLDYGVGNEYRGRLEGILKGENKTIRVDGGDGNTYEFDRNKFLDTYSQMVKEGKVEPTKIGFGGSSKSYLIEFSNDIWLPVDFNNTKIYGSNSGTEIETRLPDGKYVRIPVQEGVGSYDSLLSDLWKVNESNQKPIQTSKSTINSVINNIKNKRESGSSTTSGRNTVSSVLKNRK